MKVLSACVACSGAKESVWCEKPPAVSGPEVGGSRLGCQGPLTGMWGGESCPSPVTPAQHGRGHLPETKDTKGK